MGAGVRTNSESRRILIIDDERPILMTLEGLLNRHGYQTETAATATLGLRAMKAHPAALVLLDLQLPDADGLVLCKEIRTLYPTTCVILMTGYYADNAFDEIQDMPGVRLMNKPLPISELLATVRRMFPPLDDVPDPADDVVPAPTH